MPYLYAHALHAKLAAAKHQGGQRGPAERERLLADWHKAVGRSRDWSR